MKGENRELVAKTDLRSGIREGLLSAFLLVFLPMILGASAWDPFLVQLNQEPQYTAERPSPNSAEINADLMKLHSEESIGISKDLKTAVDPKLRGAAKRQRVNQLYFEAINHLNAATFAGVEAAAKAHAKSSIDYRDIGRKILQSVHQNPVANLKSTAAFDTNGQIGYCFGRALLVHHLLLKTGVPQADIAKIFVFGDLMVQKQMWRFHVAVMVRDSVDGWLVVDPLLPEVLPLKSWIDVAKNFEIKGKLSRARFFVTDPRKFLPSFGVYHRGQLEDPVLKKYFDALGHSLKEL